MWVGWMVGLIKEIKEGRTPTIEDVARKIATDHIKEKSNYYELLKKYIENGTTIEKTTSFILLSFIVHMPGHKDSKGKEKPWVIKSHKNKNILGSYGSRSEAEKALKRMRYFKHKGNEVFNAMERIGILPTSFIKKALNDTI